MEKVPDLNWTSCTTKEICGAVVPSWDTDGADFTSESDFAI